MPDGANDVGVEAIESRLADAAETGHALAGVVAARTVETSADCDEDGFFTGADGRTTVANRYDLEKAVPIERKPHFREVTRYLFT